MDIIEKLDDLHARLFPGDVWQQTIAEAIAEIRRMRSIAGPVDSGPSAADVMEALRHMAQAGIDAEKMLAAVYEMDVRAFVEARRLANAPQSGSVRAKLEAEKALAAAYEADVKAFAAYEANWNANAFVIDSAALRETYEFKPLPRASSTTSPPQSGSVRAKLWD